MDPIDQRFEAFRKIKESIDESSGSIVSEADARLKIINRVLTEALGWPLSQIATEERAGGGYLDYKLLIRRATRAIVEAKRVAVQFGLESRQSGQAFKLNGPAFTNEAKDAIEQCIGYCAFKNAELACVTNGLEWIIFRGNRLGDGKDTLDGKGFVFASLADLMDSFSDFHSLLSFESIDGYSYRGAFQEAEGLPVRDLSFFKRLRDPKSRRLLQRSEFAIDFDALMNSFFQRLKGEDDREMVASCFVVTKESEAADSRLSRVAEELVGSMRRLDTSTGDQLVELIESVQKHQRNRFVLLVGNKGAGKSTFIDRFFTSVLPENVATGLVIVRLDLSLSEGNTASIVEWLNHRLLEECEKAVFTESYPSWHETIGALFFDEYQRWSKGTMRSLYESNKEQFKIEFGKHVEELRRSRPHEYIKRMLRHIVKSRRQVPCIVLDNTDHFNIPFQEAVFQYARSLYESELSIAIVPITDRTSWQLSKQGALQSFESEVLYLPVPKPHRVIERRISYLLKKLEGQDAVQSRPYFFGRGIRLDVQHLTAFAASLNRVFVESEATSDWLGGLANYDIRRLLELTRELIASPHLPMDELLKAHIAQTSYPIAPWRIKQAIIKRRYDLYPEGEHAYVQNVFTLHTEAPTSPLLGLRILQFLRDASVRVDEEVRDYIDIDTLYGHICDLGFERRTIALWLQSLIRSGLVQDYDPTVTDVESATRLEITPSGKVHLIWGTADEDYIKTVKEVTPVRDRRIYDELEHFSRDPANTWSQSLMAFLRYLIEEDERWCRIPNHRLYDGQRDIRDRLRRLSNAVSRVGARYNNR